MRKLIGVVILFALMFCLTGCDIEDIKNQFGSKVDIDEALPHYGNTSPPVPTATKIDPDEAMPHYKRMQAR
jgi:hypothetical protein